MQFLRDLGYRVSTDLRWMWIAVVAGFVLFYTAYFMPALYRGALLAPGDGLLYHLPFFLAPLQVWSPLMLSGYGILGDPQAQVLYPLRILAPTYNMFVASAYIVAALGTFGLALRLTQSRMAALFAALVMSGSAFMLSHLGHVSIVHATAWAPWVLWACVVVPVSDGWKIVALGAIAIALSLLGGHPQACVIVLMLTVALALYSIVLRWRASGLGSSFALAIRFVAMFGLGILLAAPMLVPAAQAAAESVQLHWTKADFDSFRHTPASLRMLVFPNMYGGVTDGPYGGYRGPGSPTELSIYVGILPLFLALVAIGDRARRSAIWFWAGACSVAFVLMLGTLTPLGEILYRTPVLGRFGAQARFGLVSTLAFAVLAAYGIAALIRTPPTAPQAQRLFLAAFGLSLLFVLSVAFFRPSYPELPAKAWTHPSLWVPAVLMLIALASFAFLLRRPRGASVAIAIAVAAIDVASFGWFYDWRYVPETRRVAELDSDAAYLATELSSGEGRVFPVDTSATTVSPLVSNLNLAYGIPSVSGYTRMLPARYATFAGADTAGNLPEVPPSAALMDVLAVRWVAGLADRPQSQILGSGCGVPGDVRRVRARLPADARGTLRIVSHTGCSAHLQNGAGVGRVRVLRSDGTTDVAGALRAGIETAEWAYDRPDIRTVIRHERPPVAESTPAQDFRGLWFVAEIPVSAPGDLYPVAEIALYEGIEVSLTLKSIEFVHAATGARELLAVVPGYPGEEKELAKPTRARPFPAVSERVRYNGLVWSVCRARSASTAEIVAALRAPAAGGRRFEAAREALLESGVMVPQLSCSVPLEIEVRSRGTRDWKIATYGKGNALLVVSERYEGGWRARVDGAEVPILPVDGLILGVPVPEGEHVVEIRYMPPYFVLSTALFLLAVVTCAGLLLWPAKGSLGEKRGDISVV